MNKCTICGHKVKGRGLCNRHYLRLYRKGLVKQKPNRHERCLAFIDSCTSSISDACMEPPFKQNSAYPTINLGLGDTKIGHIVLEKLYGKCPPKQEMRHLCGNTRCCNGKHLVWGTHNDNMKDRERHTPQNLRGVRNPNFRHGGYCK